MLNLFKRKIPLPRTQTEFKTLVDKVVEKYDLPNKDHAAAVIGIAITHTARDQAFVTMDHLGYSVIRNIAYQVAQSTVSEMNHKNQIDQLSAMLSSDPFNQQALDQLEKASKEGSDYAKEALTKLKPAEDTATSANVLSIHGVSGVGSTQTGA